MRNVLRIGLAIAGETEKGLLRQLRNEVGRDLRLPSHMHVRNLVVEPGMEEALGGQLVQIGTDCIALRRPHFLGGLLACGRAGCGGFANLPAPGDAAGEGGRHQDHKQKRYFGTAGHRLSLKFV